MRETADKYKLGDPVYSLQNDSQNIYTEKYTSQLQSAVLYFLA